MSQQENLNFQELHHISAKALQRCRVLGLVVLNLADRVIEEPRRFALVVPAVDTCPIDQLGWQAACKLESTVFLESLADGLEEEPLGENISLEPVVVPTHRFDDALASKENPIKVVRYLRGLQVDLLTNVLKRPNVRLSILDCLEVREEDRIDVADSSSEDLFSIIAVVEVELPVWFVAGALTWSECTALCTENYEKTGHAFPNLF